jgi:hypothetical protein
MNGTNKLDCHGQTLYLIGQICKLQKTEMGLCSHNFIFYKFENKQQCYITLSWNSLPGTNTLAYMVPNVSYEENEVFVNITKVTLLYFLCNLRMALIRWSVAIPRLAMDEHSSLLVQFLSYKERDIFVNTIKFTILNFL